MHTFGVGIPCECYQRRMIWTAKFNLDEFVRGNVRLLVQNYCRGWGEKILDDPVTDIKE